MRSRTPTDNAIRLSWALAALQVSYLKTIDMADFALRQMRSVPDSVSALNWHPDAIINEIDAQDDELNFFAENMQRIGVELVGRKQWKEAKRGDGFERHDSWDALRVAREGSTRKR